MKQIKWTHALGNTRYIESDSKTPLEYEAYTEYGIALRSSGLPAS